MAPEVKALVARYLDEVDAALPGFVEGLYLVGSVALGAWQPGSSDIDTMIVTSRVAGAEDLAALARIHAALAGGPHFDGVYLDRATFAAQPADQRRVPFVVSGQLRTDRPCGELTPVVWLVLKRYGIAVRGPRVADLAIDIDSTALREYNLDNLRTYWAPMAPVVREAGATAFMGQAVVWCVLGPPRLHYTLATGDVIAKAGAGAYLAEHFPTYAALADRAVRWRRGEPVNFSAADGRAAANAIDQIVADAWNRWGQR